jgi:hypothetical protein
MEYDIPPAKTEKRPIHQHPTQLAQIRCTILQVPTLESHYLSQICRREEPLRFNSKLWKFPGKRNETGSIEKEKQ